tara:strand:+ start:883 stop:1797 length:915 start_codon:yes stop_codon:yes gene_type:complete
VSIFDPKTTIAACLAGHYGQPLGEGLWGRTFRLDDQAVLKLARADGGIGDGRDLIEREAQALAGFAGYRDPQLALPLYLGHGPVLEMPQCADDNFACWLRMGCIEGQVFSSDAHAALDTAGRELLARELGAALAIFHRLSDRHRDQAPVGDDLVSLSRRDWIFGAIMDDLPEMERIRAKRLRERYRQLLLDCPQPVWAHGDVNPSNVIRLPGGGIGLVDFAENGWDLPAVDFAHWRTLGWLDETLLASYRDHGGLAVSDESIHVVGAINAFIGLVLDRRLGDRQAVINAEAALNDCLMAARLIE